MNIQKGCTISKALANQVILFGLDKDTNISIEYYDEPKLFYVIKGRILLYLDDGNKELKANELIYTNSYQIGVDALEVSEYIEITGGINMEANQVFQLKDLINYEEGSVINKDLLSNEKMKFVLMALDQGTFLAPHKAPGDAVVFILEGEAEIIYEGVSHHLKANDNFKFDKFGLHEVKAITPFKMGLLIKLD